MARAVYTYQVASLPAPLGRGIFFGGSAEGTRASLGLDPQADKEIRTSASVFVAADTFPGPAYLAWGQAFSDDTPGALYVMPGTP